MPKRIVIPEKPKSAQLLIQFLVFHRARRFINIYTTVWFTPSLLIPLVHLSSVRRRREGKWRGNWRMEWVASTLHTTSEHGLSSITTAYAHTSAASSRLNWRPRRF